LSPREQYRISCADEDAVTQAFRQILAENAYPLAGFIHIASMGNTHGNSESDILNTIFLCAKHFKQNLPAAADSRRFFVSAVRLDGHLGLRPNPLTNGEWFGGAMQGALFGLHKSLRIEWPDDIISKAVDIGRRLPSDKAADALLEEIFAFPADCLEVGRDNDDVRRVLRLTETYRTAQSQQTPNENDVFLVTGGGRGITAKCAIKLAETYHSRFLLVGRTDLSEDIRWTGRSKDKNTLRKLAIQRAANAGGQRRPTPLEIERVADAALAQMSVEETIQAMEAAGSRVSYLSCDITDAETLKASLHTIQKDMGIITGFIHGAGVIADKKMQRKTAMDFDAVFGTKVHGLISCLDAMDAEKLRYCYLFSSIAATFGNDGQSDYAMANEVLNKFAFAFQKSHPACRVVSMNWGPWDEGMVGDSIKHIINHSEFCLIPTATGVDYFLEELKWDGEPDACLIVYNCCDHLMMPEVTFATE
jgi:NAD(P)-dependent dehydrogenase (short-subunit alcohol dehydrogenase family)